jgi:hypothetical protein
MKVSDEILSKGASSADHDPLEKDLSLSINVGTRKMVNYA